MWRMLNTDVSSRDPFYDTGQLLTLQTEELYKQSGLHSDSDMEKCTYPPEIIQ